MSSPSTTAQYGMAQASLRKAVEKLSTAGSDTERLVLLEVVAEATKLLRGLLDPKTLQASTGSGSSNKDQYTRRYYWTMARRPADLAGQKYGAIKTDPRIVELWRQATELDLAGKLNAWGQEI